MVRRAFPAEVTNGQFRFQESIADLEGRRVLLVVMEDDSPSATMSWLQLTPDPPTFDEFDIERDVSFRMPLEWEPLTATIVEDGPLRPSLIVPEEIPDD